MTQFNSVFKKMLRYNRWIHISGRRGTRNCFTAENYFTLQSKIYHGSVTRRWFIVSMPHLRCLQSGSFDSFSHFQGCASGNAYVSDITQHSNEKVGLSVEICGRMNLKRDAQLWTVQSPAELERNGRL
jgi:hypothetical protein